MKNSIRNIVVTVTFCVFVAFFVVFCTIQFFNPVEYSEAENRDLAQFPTDITWDKIVNKEKDENGKTVIDRFEDYTVDQFPFREFFRSLKANYQIQILHTKQYNNLAFQNNHIAQIETEFTDELVDYSLSRLQYINTKFLINNGCKTYISLVPDKNYYLGRDYGYPSPDYEALAEKFQAALPEAEYIDIFDCLKLEDYYRTDHHWSQDKISAVVEKLAAALGVSDSLSGNYTENRLEGFKGVYYDQSPVRPKPKPDTLVYLTNEILDSCTVYDYETGKTGSIYNLELFEGGDGYNVFLSGTGPALLRIDNPNATNDKELIVFRDSFGSSLVPLLAEGYKSIYVVDIRFIVPDLIDSFIDFEGKDVLFIYSSLILNSNSFR